MTQNQEKKWTMRDRVLAVMTGQTPDQWPFIDRIEIWYKGMLARGTMPKEYDGMSLNQVHAAVGIGRQANGHKAVTLGIAGVDQIAVAILIAARIFTIEVNAYITLLAAAGTTQRE